MPTMPTSMPVIMTLARRGNRFGGRIGGSYRVAAGPTASAAAAIGHAEVDAQGHGVNAGLFQVVRRMAGLARSLRVGQRINHAFVGVRLARLACRLLKLDPALPENRRQLYIFMEVGHRVADGVIAVTRSRPTNGLMTLVDYGKVAATFVDLRTGQAIRLSEHPDSRAAAGQRHPALDPWQAQVEAYQTLPDEQLFHLQTVTIHHPIKAPSGPSRVTCAVCGEPVHEHHEIMVDGAALCKPCASGEAYFTVIEAQPTLEAVDISTHKIISSR